MLMKGSLGEFIRIETGLLHVSQFRRYRQYTGMCDPKNDYNIMSIFSECFMVTNHLCSERIIINL